MSNFVSWRDGGKTSEEGVSKPFLRLFSSGVPISYNTSSLKVVQRGAGANMSVDVSIGDGLIAKTDYAFWTWSDAVNNVVITAADPTNPRIDAIAAYVDLAVVSSASNNNPGALKFIAVAGTPAGSPVIPSDATIQTAVGASNPFIKLSSIAVAALASNIVNANITDLRTDITYRGSVATSSWTPINSGLPTATVYNGNRSYTHTYSSSVLTYKSIGMRNKYVRTVTAPTQCTSLNGTTQYYSKTSPAGMTFTDDFTVSGWIKPNAYLVAGMAIAGRYNGTSGWLLYVESTGQISLAGYNAASGNYSKITSYQSVPLNKWVHISAELDMSSFTATPTTSYIMIDGVDVASAVSRAGTNPTALVQAGNLEIGGTNGGTLPFSGKLAQIVIYNAKVTQATIRTSMSQTLSGSETSEISAYSFSNTINDLNANANNLTANGVAVATNADSPFAGGPITETTLGTTEYSITTALSSDGLTETVQVAEGFAVPTSGGISTMAYSGQKLPYGFPANKDKWTVSAIHIATGSQATPTANVWYNVAFKQITIPIGAWSTKYETNAQISGPAGSGALLLGTLSTANNSESDKTQTSFIYANLGSGTMTAGATLARSGYLLLAAATIYYKNLSTSLASSGTITSEAAGGGTIIAECAYL